MERNSIAFAVEWSIELEKALRSKIPGRCVEAILQIGPRLEQWAGEPEATMVVYDMFGLVPGEERLFANTIFLRLAEAFQLGSKDIRISIVRVFLSLRKHCRDKKKSKRIKGILSKSRVHNHLELLRRVKIVFDTGDPESRALALILFGCWADFAKDSAQIRYVVLSSLVSSNVLEVRASLFAAGCLSELANDFASVVLEMLVNIVTYSETVSTVRLAAARVFMKMGCSYSSAKRAYKTGLKLVLDSSEEDFMIAMLISLSKLAYKSTLLISEQVDFLLLLLNREQSLRTQATALRCLKLSFVKGMGQSCISPTLIKALFSIVEAPELPSTMQCEALQLLHKILLGTPTNLLWADILEFEELLKIVGNASQSPIISKSVVATHVLVDVVIKFQRRAEMGSEGVCTLPQPSQVVSLTMDRITLLVKPLLELCQFNSNKGFEEVQSLLNLILILVGEHPVLGVLVLDKVHIFIEYLVDSCNNIAGRQNSAGDDLVDFRGERDKAICSKLMCILNRFVLSCLESLNKAGNLTNQVFDKVKLLVQSVHQCSFFDTYVYIIYSLLLDSRTIWICMINRNNEAGGVDGISCTSFKNNLYKHEIFTLEFVKRMLIQKDTWPAYRAGMYAACQGAWITARFVFRQLTMKVRSDICSCWSKSLSQWAHSELIIQLLLLSKHGSSSVDWFEMKEFPTTFSKDYLFEIEQDFAGSVNESNHSRALVVAHQSLVCAGRTLETTFTSTNVFCFQIWLLFLRAKFLGAVVEIHRVLSSLPCGQNISNDAQVGRSIVNDNISLLQQITETCFQLKRLSQEFDLIATSFFGMESRSLNVVKALALSCSMFAVSVGFAFYIPSLPAYENLTGGLGSSQKCSHAMLMQNLVGRLRGLDYEMTSSLFMLLEVTGWPKNCFHMQSKNQILDNSCEIQNLVDVCSYAVSSIFCWQTEARKIQDDSILTEIMTNGSQLLLDVILKWMSIPFRAPKFFFKIRPCFGSELFVSSVDSRSVGEISVPIGFHLSINLCLQLKNIPLKFPVPKYKFYCILHTSQKLVFHGENKEKMPWSPRPWENSDMVEMNEKLFQYVTDCTKRTNYGKHCREHNINKDDGAVTAFTQFEPNERGQGFSTCLLDVSYFSAGSYKIKWHSCCIDSQGSYWSLIPLNAEPVFTVRS